DQDQQRAFAGNLAGSVNMADEKPWDFHSSTSIKPDLWGAMSLECVFARAGTRHMHTRGPHRTAVDYPGTHPIE
ncbi:MAG: hypothetical protein ACRD9L_02905, partial [Bryobacteraceae bacterium]